MRTFMMNSIYSKISKISPIQWILAASICLLFGLAQPAIAEVTQIEEYPGKMLYQSRQNLQDQTGKAWQAIVFKRVHPEGTDTVSLRLIGFLGAMEFDHTHITCLKRFSNRVRDSNCDDLRVANTFGPLTNPKK